VSETKPAEPPRRRGTHGNTRGTGRGATRRQQSATTPEAIARHQRDLQCVRLRAANVDWQTIADRLGYASPGHAHDRFMVIMRDFPREDVDTWRDMISDRHEAILRAIWPDVLRGKLFSIDRAQRSLEALAKLHGANRADPPAPTPDEYDLDGALRDLEEQLRIRAAGQPVPQE
jgi:hypothetical protein